MDRDQARRILNEVKAGTSTAGWLTIRKALIATGDMQCTFKPAHPKQPATPVGPHDIPPFAWQVRSDRRHDHHRGPAPNHRGKEPS